VVENNSAEGDNATPAEEYTRATWLTGTSANFTKRVAKARMPRLTIKEVSIISTCNFCLHYTAPR